MPVEELYAYHAKKKLFIGDVAYEDNGRNQEVNLMFEVDHDNRIVIIIQELKPGGKAYIHKAAINRETLDEIIRKLDA